MFASCKQENHTIASYESFLSLLEEKGFHYVEEKADTRSYLSVERKPIVIGDEIISVFEYGSNTAMEADAACIEPDGYGTTNGVRISWVSYPYFFKKDTIIVNYVGENERILTFLKKNYGDVFAGYRNIH